MNLFERIFGQSEQNVQTPISDPREREREMVAKLQAIDLDNPHRQLSDEKVEQLRISAVIRDACQELRYPLVIDQDVTQLDSDLAAIISALGEAIRLGQEMTAEWACSALTFSIRNLRTEIADMDAELTAETMRCRLEYSQNLRLLVELCRKYDDLNTSLGQRTRMRRQKRQELDAIKDSYLSRRNSGVLDHLLQELRLHVSTPAAMSDEAQALRNELSQLHLLKSSVIELDIAIDADQVSLNTCRAQIDSRRNALASAPRARDPKLQDRINEADRLYRSRLQQELDEAENSIRSYAQHIAGMTDIARQSVVLSNLSTDLEDQKNQTIAQLNQQLRES